eukprot:scaffold17707_cov212-Amphora_coffeaeformis.AAC.9
MELVNSLQHSLIEHSNSIESLRGNVQQQDQTMKRLIQKIDSNPIHMLQGDAAQNNRAPGRGMGQPQQLYYQLDRSIDARAILKPNPRTLHVLWDEYVNGVGSNKPNKFFTCAERSHIKYKYSHKKIF